jgi:trehalose-6-phosphate synthase
LHLLPVPCIIGQRRVHRFSKLMGSDDILRLASVEDTTSCQKTDDNYTSALTKKRAAKRPQIESNCSSIKNHSLAGSRMKLSAGISSVVDIVAD